jgi:hypothetical protein
MRLRIIKIIVGTIIMKHILGNNHHGENHKIMLRRCYKYLTVEQYQQGLVTLEVHDYAACMSVV